MKTDLNALLNEVAEDFARDVVEDAKRCDTPPRIGMFLFDVLSQWIFDELLREVERGTDNRTQDEIAGALQDAASGGEPLRGVMASLFDSQIEAVYESSIGKCQSQAAGVRVAQFMQQLRARHPDLLEYTDNFYDVLATLDARWYCYCELAEGVGIAEAKSDRLRRYIWKTLNIVEDVDEASPTC